MAISEELELDISGALDAIESLNDSLSGLGENLTITLTTAIEAVDVTPLVEQLAALDASGLTTTIDAAIDASDGLVPIEADTAAVPGEIAASIETVDGTIPIDADAEAVPGEIDAAIASADTTVVLDANTEGFGGSIDEALAAADAIVPIEADAAGISDAIDAELASVDATIEVDATVTADGFDEIDTAADETTGKIEGIGEASTIAGSLATGSFEGAAGGIAGLTGRVGGIAAGFAAVLGVLISKGTDLKGVLQRAHDVAGPFLDDVRNINVGTLNTELGALAKKLGASEAGLLDAATNAFQFAKQSGFSGEASAEFANNVTALAARAVALNPKLGSVEEVTARLQKQFLSGRGLTQFVGQLDEAEVQAKAFALTGKTLPEELTKTDLALARAAVGAEKFGGSIDKDINKGSKNAIIQQRALNTQIQDFLAQVGKPLVAPFLKLMKTALPIVKALAPVFAYLGKDTLPIFAKALKDAAPGIKVLGETMRSLTPILVPLQKLFDLMFNPLAQIAALKGAFEALGSVFGPVGTAVGDVLGVFGDIPGAIGDAIGSFTGINDAIGSFLVTIVDLGGDLIDSFLVGIQEAFPAVVNFFASVGSTILTTIGDFVSTLTQKGTDLITGFFTGITTTVVNVFTFFANLAGRVFATIGDVTQRLVQKGSDLIGGLLSGLATRVVEVFNFFRGLPGRIVTAFGNVTNRLFNLGSDIIQGLINGIKSKAKGFFDTIKDLTKRGVHLITHPWEALSPSRVTLELGKNIGEGLALGIQSQVSAVEDAASALSAAAAITPATLALPVVAATVPLSGGTAGAAAAGPVTSAQADLAGAGTGVHIGQLIVQTAAKDQTQVGIEVSRQLRAESFRAGR